MKLKKIPLIIILVLFCIISDSYSKDRPSPKVAYKSYLMGVQKAKSFGDLKPYYFSGLKSTQDFDRILKNPKRSQNIFKFIKSNSIFPDRLEYLRIDSENERSLTVNIYSRGQSLQGKANNQARMKFENGKWILLHEDYLHLKSKRQKSAGGIKQDILKRLPGLDKATIDKIMKWFAPSFIALILILIVSSILGSKKQKKRHEELLKGFSLKYGFNYLKDDNFKLKELIAKSGFSRNKYHSHSKAYSILYKSDRDGDFFIFTYSSGQGKQNSINTVFLYKLNSSFSATFQIRKRLPGFIEKLIGAMTNAKLKAVKSNDEGFNKHFVVYTSDETYAHRAINFDVVHLLNSNKKHFKNMLSVIHASKNTLMLLIQHSGLKFPVRTDSKLKEKIDFCEQLKDRFLKTF